MQGNTPAPQPEPAQENPFAGRFKNKNTCIISSPFIQNTKFNYKMTDSGIEETESI